MSCARNAEQRPKRRSSLGDDSFQMAPQAEVMLERLARLTADQQAQLGNALTGAVRSIADARLAAAAVALLAVLVAVALAYRFQRSIVGPVRRLTGVAERVAAGDLSARAAVESGDEIGLLARSINTMTQRLSDTIAHLESVFIDAQRAKDTVICLPPDRGLSVSLAMEDLAEVSSFSRRVMSQPVSVRLQNGLRLLRIPLPASHQSSLRSTCRCRRFVGLTVFRTHHNAWGRSCLYTGGLRIRVRRNEGRRSRPRTVLVQACQHLCLVMHNDACNSSLLLTMPLSLASHPP